MCNEQNNPTQNSKEYKRKHFRDKLYEVEYIVNQLYDLSGYDAALLIKVGRLQNHIAAVERQYEAELNELSER